MSWNYRVIRHPASDIEGDEPTFAIHEVYYDDQGNPNGWTDATDVSAESVADVVEVLAMMLRATERPVLCVEGSKLVPFPTPEGGADGGE